MKCPNCGANHRRKAGMKCRCGYGFVLDPHSDKMTDRKLCSVERRASSNGTYFYTMNQLCTAYSQSFKRHPWRLYVGLAFLSCGLVGLVGMRQPAFLFALFIGISMLVSYVATARAPDLQRFRNSVAKYVARKGPFEKLLTDPTLHIAPPDFHEQDLYDYGIERILVVQHDLLVDLLVKNNAHTSQRALILSSSGYPEYVLPLAMKSLVENPDLAVYFLHDSTSEGVRWFQTISSSDKLPWADHPKVDLGLQPTDVERIKRLECLQPDKSNYQVAVDCLPYGMLCAGLAGAMDEQQSFGELLAMDQAARASSGPASFG